MEILDGKIVEIDERGLTIRVPYPDTMKACLRKYDAVQVGLPDGRTISPEQRKKAYALMNEIADWMGDTPEYIKRLMKLDFISNKLQALQKSIFSLSNCDVTTAKEYISHLIEFIVMHGVPCKQPLYELCEDIEKYVYACLMNKRCVVCGADRADLHHHTRIGMGNNRDDIYQIGMPVFSLCRIHHGFEHDHTGWLENDLHLTPVKLTQEIGKVYKLTKKNLNKGE